MSKYSKLKSINVVIILSAILATEWLLLSGENDIFDLFLSGFNLWILIPYFCLLLFLAFAQSQKIVVTLSILSILCCLGIFLYIDAIFIHPDAQGALIFIFVPLYQLGVIILGYGIIGVIKLYKRFLVKK